MDARDEITAAARGADWARANCIEQALQATDWWIKGTLMLTVSYRWMGNPSAAQLQGFGVMTAYTSNTGPRGVWEPDERVVFTGADKRKRVVSWLAG